jgi:AraC family transcriptional regulator of adaptative response/methylated-DNA-[protein]-cysteine methyltransferase
MMRRALRDLLTAFPDVDLVEDAVRAGDALACAVMLVDRPQSEFALPLDLRGNMQELAVWQALREILPARPAAMVSWPGRCPCR